MTTAVQDRRAAPSPWQVAADLFAAPDDSDFDPVAELRAAGLHVWDRCDGDCPDQCGGWEPSGGGEDLVAELLKRDTDDEEPFDFASYGQVATQGDVLRALFAIALDRPELAPGIDVDPEAAELYVHGSPSTGKSHIAAVLAHLWLRRFVPSFVLDTARDHRQVKHQHWKHFRRLAPTLAPEHPPPNKTEWEISPGHGALGFASSDGGGIKGFHEAAQMYIINEGDACEDFVFEAASRVLTGPLDVLLVLANAFWRDSVTCERLERGQGTHLRLDATDFISYQEAHPSERFDGAASPKWLRGVERDFGTGSDDYLANAHAIYPAGDETAAFSPRLISQAFQRYRAHVGEYMSVGNGHEVARPLRQIDQVGMDIAGLGRDRTIWAGRWGQEFMGYLRRESKTDHSQNRLRAQQFHEQHDPDAWVLDASGEGSGTERELSNAGVPVDRFIWQNAQPVDRHRYADRGTEAYAALSDYVKAGGALPPSQELRKQLEAVRFVRTEVDDPDEDHLPKGQRDKIVVVKMDRAGQRRTLKGRSPDEADACAMAATPAQVQEVGGIPAAEVHGVDEPMYDDEAGMLLEGDF